MKIRVKLFATLRDGRFSEEILEYDDTVIVGDIIRQLNIDRGKGLITILNHVHVKEGSSLKDGDTLAIFPVVGGG